MSGDFSSLFKHGEPVQRKPDAAPEAAPPPATRSTFDAGGKAKALAGKAAGALAGLFARRRREAEPATQEADWTATDVPEPAPVEPAPPTPQPVYTPVPAPQVIPEPRPKKRSAWRTALYVVLALLMLRLVGIPLVGLFANNDVETAPASPAKIIPTPAATAPAPVATQPATVAAGQAQQSSQAQPPAAEPAVEQPTSGNYGPDWHPVDDYRTAYADIQARGEAKRRAAAQQEQKRQPERQAPVRVALPTDAATQAKLAEIDAWFDQSSTSAADQPANSEITTEAKEVDVSQTTNEGGP